MLWLKSVLTILFLLVCLENSKCDVNVDVQDIVNNNKAVLSSLMHTNCQLGFVKIKNRCVPLYKNNIR